MDLHTDIHTLVTRSSSGIEGPRAFTVGSTVRTPAGGRDRVLRVHRITPSLVHLASFMVEVKAVGPDEEPWPAYIIPEHMVSRIILEEPE